MIFRDTIGLPNRGVRDRGMSRRIPAPVSFLSDTLALARTLPFGTQPLEPVCGTCTGNDKTGVQGGGKGVGGYIPANPKYSQQG